MIRYEKILFSIRGPIIGSQNFKFVSTCNYDSLSPGTGRAVQPILGSGERNTSDNYAPRRL